MFIHGTKIKLIIFENEGLEELAFCTAYKILYSASQVLALQFTVRSLSMMFIGGIPYIS